MLDLSTLNPAQRDAVRTVEGPLLILAGAGTGKTRVITLRLAHMIHQGVPADRILAVTFTNKAAREMHQRVHGLLPGKGGSKRPRPTISTFHSLGVRVLRQHIGLLGYKPNFVIYTQSDQLGLVRRLLSRIASKDVKVQPQAVLSCLSRIKNNGSEHIRFSDSEAAAMADHLKERYDASLRAANAVDFDDLLLLTLRLFREHPEVLAEYRDRFRYVMVDEYQDTNAAQFALLKELTRGHQNLCVVGDDDQSIYGWRGAEVANLNAIERDYDDVKVVKLEKNYRSTNVILQAANAVIQNNPRRHSKQLWSDMGTGDRIAYRVFESDEQEAESIVESIQTASLVRNIPWSSQAILFRTNQQSRPLETALRQAGIRYHLVGGQSFFDRREIKDLLAYLKVLLNPEDDNSLLRIANVPARGLSDATMERLLGVSHERGASVFQTMRHTDVQNGFSARTQKNIANFLELLERYRQPLELREDLSLKEWVSEFLKEIEYFEELKRTEKHVETAENRIRIVQEMIASLEDVTGAELSSGSAGMSWPARRLQAFLEGVCLDNDRPDSGLKGNPSDAVTLITVHSCKGLEFPHVYLVGLEEGIFPHSRSKTEGNIDEERRLFYVALTRAQVALSLSYCHTRKKYGQSVACHPSRFLKELPEELLEQEDSQSKKTIAKQDGKRLFDAMRSSIDG